MARTTELKIHLKKFQNSKNIQNVVVSQAIQMRSFHAKADKSNLSNSTENWIFL